MGYSPWGCKESDTTERIPHHIATVIYIYTHSQYLIYTYMGLPGAPWECVCACVCLLVRLCVSVCLRCWLHQVLVQQVKPLAVACGI